ncbi:F-box/kelch-repeat protein At3g06240-like [Papaver somniferum]|uniref:F-box/kelch-repeat protein At3g06240-like n=1 Tax=Papaver somniferum TaxID=3469 RepID=UPI000E6FA2D0|nr:F-box/kelch-repeat protein At3g06240-like [Papaver somniferum]
MFYSIDHASILSASSSPSSSGTCKCEGAVLMDDPMKGDVLSADRYHTKMFACNGLLCLNLNGDRTLILWNPYTKESKKIELPSCVLWPAAKGYGFGYDSSINDYKFVYIVWNEVNVYMLGSDLWRRVNTTTTCNFSYDGLHFNGVLHWLGTIVTRERTKLIVAFDLSSETYMNLHFPEETITLHADGNVYFKLQVLGDSLCLVCGLLGRVGRVDVWVIQNYGVRESWIKKFTTTEADITRHPFFLEFHWSFDNGEILVQVQQQFFLYDQENDRVRWLNINATDDNFSCVKSKSDVESLVSLTCNRNLFI